MTTHYQLLNWDSDIFGYGVAKIVPVCLDHQQLKLALSELKQQNVRLVYWCSDSLDEKSQQAAEAEQGFLADRKVTYLMSFAKNFTAEYDKNLITEYTSTESNEDLELLALQIGFESRFALDPKISSAVLEQVYKTWMANSTNKQVADKVLVVRKDKKIVGMVTLSEKNKRGDIGLLAVHPDYRGLQIGKNLVGAAQEWCVQQGYADGQVVTQQTNKSACALYEKCGYALEKVENFYHFWL